MLHLRQIVRGPATRGSQGTASPTLTLCLADRRKSRLRTVLDDGREASLLLPRGSSLRDGDCLLDELGQMLVMVRAAAEVLSVARSDDRYLLTRAAYHLGNRHVLLQVGSDWLAYQHDHVLDAMVRALGLAVAVERRPFEPEAGVYEHSHRELHTAERHDH